MMTITRFAPSPTGRPHLGNIRTALFNWLWARHNHGQFILRIEDTDQQRSQPELIETIMATIKGLGLEWDWGPDKPSPKFGNCRQSQRLDTYRQIATELIDKGIAYYDQTTPEQLENLRQQARDSRQPFVFRRSMAVYDPGADVDKVIRISLGDDQEFRWLDAVKGNQKWSGADIGDFIILKSDGYPTYQLASVVDDHLMGVSTVIRGDEWLSSTPKHLLITKTLGWDSPTYAHIPSVLGPTGNRKMSKRDGNFNDVSGYIDQGYPVSGLLNFLALLGWHPGGEKEIFTVSELIAAFGLNRLQTSPARFDQKRLEWICGHHIRSLPALDSFNISAKWWPAAAADFSDDYRRRVLRLVIDRLRKWADLDPLTDFFFNDPERTTNEEVADLVGIDLDQVGSIIEAALVVFGQLKADDDLEVILRNKATEMAIKLADFFMVLRYCLTGQTKTANLIDIIGLLGQEVCLRRLRAPSSNG